jgi:hypothetical protein
MCVTCKLETASCVEGKNYSSMTKCEFLPSHAVALAVKELVFRAAE